MTKSTVTKLKRKAAKNTKNISGEVYVTNPMDFAVAKEVALIMLPKLYSATDGNYLIQMQVLDILQDNLALQAIKAKNELKQEQANETNKSS